MRLEDYGILWEHLSLNTYKPGFLTRPCAYRRDKQGHEGDFVLSQRRDEVDAIECKWNSDSFDSTAVEIFRQSYPNGRNYLVTPVRNARLHQAIR